MVLLEISILFGIFATIARVESSTHCEMFSQRNVLTKDDREQLGFGNKPPLLWSIPGSGNTYTRALIEYASGYFTGSPYNDESLVPLFPLETSCDTRAIAVKLHPYILPVGKKTLNPSKYLKHVFGFNASRNDVPLCPSIGFFERALIIMRHPIHTIWADYQRFYSVGNHTFGMEKDTFDAHHFAHRGRYQAWMIKKSLALFQAVIDVKGMENGKELKMIYFEDFINEKKYDTLADALQFFGIDPNMSRVKCAFELASKLPIKRERTMSALEAMAKSKVCRQIFESLEESMLAHGYIDHKSLFSQCLALEKEYE